MFVGSYLALKIYDKVIEPCLSGLVIFIFRQFDHDD